MDSLENITAELVDTVHENHKLISNYTTAIKGDVVDALHNRRVMVAKACVVECANSQKCREDFCGGKSDFISTTVWDCDYDDQPDRTCDNTLTGEFGWLASSQGANCVAEGMKNFPRGNNVTDDGKQFWTTFTGFLREL
jgi:hypothetical protein